MNVYFNNCSDAINYASSTKTYGLFYSNSARANKDIHIHECCEIHFCLSGGNTFLINDRIYDVNDGNIFVINQFEPHKITYDEDKIFSRFVLQVHPEFLYNNSTDETDLSESFFSRSDSTSHKLSLNENEIKDFKEDFLKLTEFNRFGDDILKNIYVLKILTKINSIFNERCENKEYLVPENNTLVLKTVSYINQHLSDDINLETIAKNSYISVNKLGKLFKKHLGTTVTKYIISRRITEAKKCLKNGKSVSETAELCGFRDYANFIRTFKNVVGISPGKYAK